MVKKGIMWIKKKTTWDSLIKILHISNLCDTSVSYELILDKKTKTQWAMYLNWEIRQRMEAEENRRK